MDEFVRKVYERGKITIPKELRNLYGVQDGDMVKMKIVRVVRQHDMLRGEDIAPDAIVDAEGFTIDLAAEADDDAKEVA